MCSLDVDDVYENNHKFESTPLLQLLTLTLFLWQRSLISACMSAHAHVHVHVHACLGA